MAFARYLSPARTSFLFPLLPKTSSSSVLLFHHHRRKYNHGFFHHLYFLSTSTIACKSPKSVSPETATTMSKKQQKKANRESPESVLKFKLDMCSKHGDVVKALGLYDEARSNGVNLNQHHYNVMIYLCSCSTAENDVDLGSKRGFEIFEQMVIDGVAPNESTFTNAARLASKMDDPQMAFDLVKKMMGFNIPPKLRSYVPALHGFCHQKDADKAFQVDDHMLHSGVAAEEPELAALLGISTYAARGDKVYDMLHRLRVSIRQVSESTAHLVENWFNSDAAAQVGNPTWDVSELKQAVLKAGGGWHGHGWLGKGKWKVVRTHINKTGVCTCCGEKLVCIDIDPFETENFASSLASLACKKEVRLDFNKFQEWLRRNGPFDAVIDGANVGLINSSKFSFFQLKSVVERIRSMSSTRKSPLVVLHTSRIHGGPADSPINKKLLENWRTSGALYPTPIGSNDDWYWLYAAVSSKCLLVTNDEMRDHLFQLLGKSFFPRWKEKHQVRLTISTKGPTLHMPPPYSIVIQESEGGSWHIPTVIGDDIETPRQWICATRLVNRHPIEDCERTC